MLVWKVTASVRNLLLILGVRETLPLHGERSLPFSDRQVKSQKGIKVTAKSAEHLREFFVTLCGLSRFQCEQNNLRGDAETHRYDAGADAGSDEEVMTVFNYVSALVALTEL